MTHVGRITNTGRFNQFWHHLVNYWQYNRHYPITTKYKCNWHKPRRKENNANAMDGENLVPSACWYCKQGTCRRQILRPTVSNSGCFEIQLLETCSNDYWCNSIQYLHLVSFHKTTIVLVCLSKCPLQQTVFVICLVFFLTQ